MRLAKLTSCALSALSVGTISLVPATASAQWHHRDSDHRRHMQNEWRDIAAASGGLALLGALNRDNTLAFAGTAGALYSLYRYDQDRRGDDRIGRLRAEYFSRPYFYRDGVRYDRRTVRHGHDRYYQFYRHDD